MQLSSGKRTAADLLCRRSNRLKRFLLFMSLATCALFGTTTYASEAAARQPIAVSDRTFGCISDLVPVRGFFVGNLLGNLAGTLKVAQSSNGGTYPPGSMIQLVPTEVMIKQRPGFNAATKDWEFFEVDVSKDGSKIAKRGFVEVVNRFGGNCFSCHVRAHANWDFVCETGHGCDPLPLTTAMIGALQRTDPRCKGADQVSPEDAAALRALSDMLRPAASTQ